MNDKKARSVCIAAALLFAFLFALLVVSPENIDPLNTRWVINGGGDNLQHYLGWRFFRNSRWTRYLLFMKDLGYPVGTSVIVTDSNPLCCLVFKLFRGILPEQMQFNGIWIMSSYLLIALFSVLIGMRLTNDVLFCIAGSVIAVLNPVVLQRALIHENLTAHWLILAAVWLFLNDDKKRNPAGWLILTGLSLLIHIYFIPMIAFILVLQMIRMALKKRPFLQILMPLFIFCMTLAAGYFLLGYSYIMPQSGSFGELSMNFNAFINPDGTSALLQDRPTMPLQYEGFNYLGLGLLFLTAAGIIFSGGTGIRKLFPFMVPVLLLILAAVSQNAYFDLKPVYQIRLPQPLYDLLSFFRSSGRLVWPLFYLILFASLHFLACRSKRYPFLIWLVLGCVLLQGFDLKDFIFQTAERFRHPMNTITEIPSDAAEMLSGDIQHLFAASGDSKTVDALALFAADHHMTFNRIANARGIRPVFGDDVLEMETLTCDQLDSGSAYVYFSAGDVPNDLESCPMAKVGQTGSWIIIRSLK